MQAIHLAVRVPQAAVQKQRCAENDVVVLGLQAHGQRTQWAFMLDADFAVRGGWRLRLAVQRLARECAARSVMHCPKGIMVRPDQALPCMQVCSLLVNARRFI